MRKLDLNMKMCDGKLELKSKKEWRDLIFGIKHHIFYETWGAQILPKFLKYIVQVQFFTHAISVVGRLPTRRNIPNLGFSFRTFETLEVKPLYIDTNMSHVNFCVSCVPLNLLIPPSTLCGPNPIWGKFTTSLIILGNIFPPGGQLPSTGLT